MISPISSALDTRVLMAEVYCLGYSAFRRTLAMVIRLFWYPSLIRAKPLAN